MSLNINEIRKDFPILGKKVGEKNLIYLDNAATTQKPARVIEALTSYYHHANANPHRGAHYLGVSATKLYDDSKDVVKEFIHAKSHREIIYTKNASEALNLLAYTYGMTFIEEGDEILISILEHHSNLIPWQQVAKAKGAILKYLYVNEEGIIPSSEIKEKITQRTKLVSVTHVSNALGTINPVKEIIDQAHKMGAKVILDGSQSIPHMAVDVQELDADFVVFSGHKMLAPMGIGVLYGKEELLEKLPPFLYGGDMIEYVHEQESTFAELPERLEAGTQNVPGALGLMEAIGYLENIGMDEIEKVERELTAYAMDKMEKLDFLEIYGPRDIKKRAGIISFNIKDVHPHDAATILDSYGVAVRAGHHCAQPLMRYMGINATTRASFYFYNTKEEIDVFVESLKNVRKWLGYGS
ncbi:cysteine desulfurase [Irregularibacter muris]|uniref:cysteine desulfurase n=1 Tax=Irregularibacter muris TaxID=1796619 RepID=A0AAE3KZJ7_9FIRM|nr:cysteine desulfurase [Irregularibacter muris]MCR1899340.1 cysteine desulfurase [Irregularibacter muris]